MEHITISKSAFAALISSLYYPNPDDPGPYGPGGSVMGEAVSRFRPPPQPWRADIAVNAIVERVMNQYQAAAILGAEGRALEVMGGYVSDVVDDWCPTRPKIPKWPFPPRRNGGFIAIELLAAGAQFQQAAVLDNAMSGIFAKAADRLFEVGLQQLEAI